MENHMPSSSSAHDAHSNRRENRRRASRVGYNFPSEPDKLTFRPGLNGTSQKDPEFVLCDKQGSSLEPDLVPLARTLFEFDFELLHRVHAFHRKYISSPDEARKAEADRWVEKFADIKQQWKDIDSGRRQFHHSYMRDDSFIPIWAEGLRIVKEVFQNNNNSNNQSKKKSDYMDILKGYESLAWSLRNRMVDTALQGLLEEKIISSIRNRWMRLDSSINRCYVWYNRSRDSGEIPWPRSAPEWSEVRRSVEANDQKSKSDMAPVQSQLARRSGKTTQPGTTSKLGSKADGPFVLCSVLFGCGVTSTAMFALGYASSPHLKGTTNDADFWFLIQASIMQLLGLSVSAVLERKSGSLPQWRWAIPTAIAGCFSIISIPLYLAVPTEWSSFLSLTAGATQSFMILQHFLS